MDGLRNKHPHAITALEHMMTEIGALSDPSEAFHPAKGPLTLMSFFQAG
jgi:hypothetical protein